MYWPRLRLTPEEAKHVGKYTDTRVGKKKPGVMRSMYPGTLIVSPQMRTPIYQFAIATRSRVFAITFAGDWNCFQLQISDSAGEVFQMTPLTTAHFGTGPNTLPFGTFGSPPVAGPVFPGYTPAPCIFDPNILLLSNQTLSIAGFGTADSSIVPDARLDFTLHVWEFPGMNGSPSTG
jgi:hypothetical protein